MKHSKIVALSCLALVQASFVAPAQAAPGSRACGMYFQRTVPGRSPTEYQARVVFAEIRTAHAEHKDHCDAAVKKSRVRSLDGGGSNGTVARTFRMKTCEEVGTCPPKTCEEQYGWAACHPCEANPASCDPCVLNPASCRPQPTCEELYGWEACHPSGSGGGYETDKGNGGNGVGNDSSAGSNSGVGGGDAAGGGDAP